MKKLHRLNFAVLCTGLLFANVYAAGDAPPPPPGSGSSSSTTTTDTNKTTAQPVVVNLPTGSTTTTQTDGSIKTTLPTTTTEGGQQTSTAIVTKTDNTSTLTTQVSANGQVAAQTTVSVATKSTITVTTDGSTKVDIGGAAPVTAVLQPTGRTSLAITATTGQQNSIALPRGAQVSVDTGKFTASETIKVTGSQSASVTVQATSTGSLVTSAVVATSTGTNTVSVQSYAASTKTQVAFVKRKAGPRALRDDTTVSSVDEVNTSLGTEEYDAILSRFTSERRFTVAERILRSTDAKGSKTEINATTASTFEEVVSFIDGYRTIMLTSGSAKIIVDGVESDMKIGELYVIPTKRTEEVLASVAKHAAGKLNLKKGWNIVTPPAPCKVYGKMFTEVASTSASGAKLVYVFKRAGGTYEAVGYTGAIEPGQGVYVKVDSDKELDFSYLVPNTSFDFAAFYKSVADYGGWRLLGAPIQMSVKSILDSGAQKFISIQGNSWSSWYDGTLQDTTSTTVDAGTGFWIQ